MNRMLLLLIVLCVGLPLQAEESTASKKRKVTSDALTGFTERVYKRVGEAELKLRIYHPESWKPTDKRPAIVFFFGGGWRNGTPKQFHHHCLHLAKQGMVATAAEYRIKSVHGSTPFDSTEDAKSALRWIRVHASELGIDPDRLAAGGGSAGGHLAAATATIGEAINAQTDDLSVIAVPNAVVLFNPALNLKLPAVRERWGDDVYEKVISISPHQNVTGDLPPCIIFHGRADKTVPFETAQAFVDRALEKGAKQVRLVGYDDQEHGFFNYERNGGESYRKTVNEMTEFFRDLEWIDNQSR